MLQFKSSSDYAFCFNIPIFLAAEDLIFDRVIELVFIEENHIVQFHDEFQEDFNLLSAKL